MFKTLGVLDVKYMILTEVNHGQNCVLLFFYHHNDIKLYGVIKHH